MTHTVPDTEYFRSLEERLWSKDAEWRDRVLTDDFTEFCRFGEVYDREHLLQPAAAAVEVDLPFDSFSVEALTDDVVLVTYENTVHTNGSTERARRASIWLRTGGEWRLRFMQATTLDA